MELVTYRPMSVDGRYCYLLRCDTKCLCMDLLTFRRNELLHGIRMWMPYFSWKRRYTSTTLHDVTFYKTVLTAFATRIWKFTPYLVILYQTEWFLFAVWGPIPLVRRFCFLVGKLTALGSWPLNIHELFMLSVSGTVEPLSLTSLY